MFESLQLLRLYNPNSLIIVSTWKSDDSEELRMFCHDNRIIFLLNDEPLKAGGFHLNYQLHSTRAGLRYIENNPSIKYVLKIRTDQRYYRGNMVDILKNLLCSFPPYHKSMKARIVMLGTGINSSILIPFHVSDFLFFGEIEDMNNLFGIDDEDGETSYLQENASEWFKFRDEMSCIEHQYGYDVLPDIKKRVNDVVAKFTAPEMFLLESWCQQIYESQITDYMMCYLKLLHDCVCVVNDYDLGFYWSKYRWMSNEMYNVTTRKFHLDFYSWLNVYLHGVKVG